MAYRAEIEIGVRGTRDLERLRSSITQTTTAFESLNRIAGTRGSLVQNLANYTNQVNRASRAIDNVTAGSQAETKAIREYVTALGQANTARARQNYLIEQEIANRRRVQATMNAGFGQQGPAVPPSMRNAGFGQFGPALPPVAAARARGGIGRGISGAVSNAAIGGAFPLLFGQGGGAAAGGALGGIAGSFLGPSGGFAGSLVGTIIGEKLGQGSQIKELAADIGFSAEQTKLLADAFKQAGKEFDKFDQSVQNIRGLSLSIDDQADSINLVSTLTEKYGGQIDKVTNAFTSALESGKVTQATLNQLTSQGIPIQQALADKYGVSRDAILKMAKDGKISTQELTDTLVDMGNKGVAAVNKPVSGFDQFNAGVKSLISAIGDLASAIVRLLTPAFDWLAKQLAVIINAAAQGIQTVATLLSGGNAQTVVANARARKRLAAEGGPSTGTRYLTPEQQARLNILQQEEQKKSIKPAKIGAITAPGQAPPSGGSKGTSAADKAAKAAEREAARVANIVRDRAAEMEILRMQMIYAEQIAVAEINKDPVLKSQLETTQKINQISLEYTKAINDEKAKGNSAAAKEAITKKAMAEVDKINFEGALDIAKIEIERKENYSNLLMDLDQELKLRYATTDEARNQLQIEYEMAKLKQTNAYKPEELAAIQSRKQQAVAPKTDQQSIADRVGKLTDELKELTKLSTIVTTSAEAIGTAFSTSFKGIIDGSLTAREALASFFQSVADAFLDMAAQIIAKWIEMTILNTVLSLFPSGVKTPTTTGAGTNFTSAIGNDTGISWASSLAGRASGGPVSAGTPYMVGEKGPELFVPGSSGSIVPNDAMGGGVQVGAINISVQNTGDTLSAAAQKQIAGQVQSIVLSTLVDQRRNGGVLTR